MFSISPIYKLIGLRRYILGYFLAMHVAIAHEDVDFLGSKVGDVGNRRRKTLLRIGEFDTLICRKYRLKTP